MPLQIKLKLDTGRSEGRYLDRYEAIEGDWHFEIYVPRGERPRAVDVHFEFDSSDGEAQES